MKAEELFKARDGLTDFLIANMVSDISSVGQQNLDNCLKNGPIWPHFVYFRPILNTMTNIVQKLTFKSVDGVLGIRTLDRRMVGADESIEL